MTKMIAVPNQVLYECTGSDVEFVVDYSGTVTYTQVCSWVTAAQILTYLGIATATVDDTTFVTQCASAANNFAYRRRQECGYNDSLTTSPSGDVTLATIMYGAALTASAVAFRILHHLMACLQARLTGYHQSLNSC
jgi:hypothetical protein